MQGNFNQNQSTDLTDLITNIQNGNKILAQILNVLSRGIPQIVGTAATATAGAATLPANPVGFIVVTLQNGSSVKLPYYAS